MEHVMQAHVLNAPSIVEMLIKMVIMYNHPVEET